MGGVGRARRHRVQQRRSSCSGAIDTTGAPTVRAAHTAASIIQAGRAPVVQVLVCARCGGARRILGAVTEPHAVRRLLGALGRAAQPLPHRSVTAP